jgi:HD superfamily phosphodiesterase
MAVVMAAAYLHDIGSEEAESKYDSSTSKHRQVEGLQQVRKVLGDLQAAPVLIDEVCDLLGRHHQPHKEETINFKVLHDAALIVNLADRYRQTAISEEKLEHTLASSFLTEAGMTAARNTVGHLG